MGYCKGIKASIFSCTFFHFLKKYTFDKNFFSWEVGKTVSAKILFDESTHFSAKRQKFLPLKVLKVIEIFSIKIIIFSISSFINFFSHDSVQNFELCLLITCYIFIRC